MEEKLKDYIARLDKLGIPVAYDHFEEMTDPPFICWATLKSQTSGADTYHPVKRSELTIILYSSERDFETEDNILRMFSEFEIDVESSFVLADELYATTFQFEIIERL